MNHICLKSQKSHSKKKLFGWPEKELKRIQMINLLKRR